MSDIAIRVEGLSKRYRIGERERYYTLRDVLARSLANPIRSLRSQVSKFVGSEGPHIWALKDVSFEVKRGELIGIIGRNGAGKSTLLKILSRITKPTRGQADIHGRVGSLLEVGTGFHPELTGRENIYFNGAILGMKKTEIDRRFDEIVAFAELEKFMDTAVKHYSSGMYTRLAFAVAAHLEPEILLVDEVLAVGDNAFQKKCLGKIGEVAHGGRTVLFVSHNMTAVKGLCSRALWVDGGRVAKQGPVASVMATYLQDTITSNSEQVWSDPETAPGNHDVKLHCVRILAYGKTPVDHLTVIDPFAVEIQYWNLKHGARLNVSIVVYNEEGVCVFSSTSEQEPDWHGRSFPSGLFRSVCQVPGDLLNNAMYRVTLLIVQDSAHVLYSHEDVLMFDIHDSAERRGSWYGEWPGVTRVNLKWTTELLSQTLAATAGSHEKNPSH